jgi:hypothetical protein
MHVSWQKIAETNPSVNKNTLLLYSLVESKYTQYVVRYDTIL